ncbi:hypothetical protein GCM10025868_16070 [Angustibacter aerolatus]|uniref:DUF559 domain-containing protein n=1 Tax=Angustibacter aerolatus TaxID=1162965 RepID=A0ABQ6JHI9_9ACTN|nr:hypothetical protein GCM10025868_16070 [Angustibacter aerolatus]
MLGEFDGAVKYGRLLRPGQDVGDVVLAERRREQALERAGWVVVRFTWREVHDADLVGRRLAAAVQHAARRGLARPGRLRPADVG